MARMKDYYKESVAPALFKKFGYKSVMQTREPYGGSRGYHGTKARCVPRKEVGRELQAERGTGNRR